MSQNLTQIEKVKQFVIKEIGSEEKDPNGRLPSLRKIASELGVTHNSAWKAFKQLKDEKYVINNGSRYQIHPGHCHSKETTLNISFEAYGKESIHLPFIKKVHQHLQSKEFEENINIHLILKHDESPLNTNNIPSNNILLLSSGPGLGASEELTKKGVPNCALFPDYKNKYPCSIHLNDFRGGELVAEYISEQDCKQVILLGESLNYPQNWHESFALRSYGFKTQWIKSGRDIQSITEKPLPIDIFAQMDAIKEISSSHTGGTAYFCLSDSIAILLKKAFLQKGEDPAIVGFDNLDETVSLNIPSIDHNFTNISEQIIKLARILEQEGIEHKENLYTNPTLQTP